MVVISAIIQARMGSHRLPGKVMKKIKGKPLLYYVLNQMKFSKLLENIVVATTDLSEDDVIEKFLKKKKINCFRGSSKNVLDRYYNCAKKFKIQTIVRITADCPLIDPCLIDQVIKKFQTEKYDYVSNAYPRTFPYGTEVEIFSFDSLSKSWENAVKPSEKEHVTPYIKNHPKNFKIGSVENKENISEFRWTVDREEDLKLVKEIIRRIPEIPILTESILKLMKKEPKLKEINSKIIPNEGMNKSLKEDMEFLKEKYEKD
jgi:spore coat polysaccharide biosynthesis protein SpsF